MLLKEKRKREKSKNSKKEKLQKEIIFATIIKNEVEKSSYKTIC